MQIDQTNYTPQEIFKDIDEAAFISLDLEFSGLNLNDDDYVTHYDSLEEQYQKTKLLCHNHHVLQFGLALFHPKFNGYIPKVYNFYLQETTNTPMMYKQESYKFLAQNGFDFTRTLTKGLTFRPIMNPQGNIGISHKQVSYLSTQIEQDLHKIRDQIIQELYLKKQSKVSIPVPKDLAKIIISKQDSLFDGYPRFTIELVNDDRLNLKIAKTESKFGAQMEQQEQPAQEFQLIIKYIIDQRKMQQLLNMGHNPCIDLCLIYHKFIDTLPKTYTEYAKALLHLFPVIYDTKIIAKAQNIKKLNSSLEGLYKDCITYKKPLHQFNNVQIQLNQQNFHDAGFDAFATGVVFVSLTNYVTQKFDHHDFTTVLAKYKNIINSCTDQNPFNFIQLNNISHNPQFLNNTLYCTYPSRQIIEKFWIHLKDLGSFTVTELTKNSCFITMANEQSLQQVTASDNDLHIVKYENRKTFFYFSS